MTTHLQEPGWSIVNNVSYGGIARLGHFVFVGDMTTYNNGGEPKGIVRFDLRTGATTRFAAESEFEDLTVGLNGMLYAQASSVSKIFDPNTLNQVGTVFLETPGGSADVRGMAVDQQGFFYAADWDGWVSKYNADGSFVRRIQTGGTDLTDIDINVDGTLAIGSRFGDVFLTDTSLEAVTSFAVQPGAMPTVFVAFTSAVPEPESLAFLVAGLGVLALTLRGKGTLGQGVRVG